MASPFRSNSKNDRKTVSRKRLWYRWVLMAASMMAVSWVAVINFGKLSGADIDINLYYMGYAFLATVSAYLTMFLIWTRLASIFELRAPVSVAGRAYYLSYLARYIPGKIGIFLMRAEIYGGRSNPGVIMATAIEQLAVLSAASLMVLLGILLTPSIFPQWLRLTSIAGLAAMIFVMRPSVLSTVARLIGRITDRKVPLGETTFRANLGLMALYTIPCLLHGLSLFLVIRSLYPISFSYLPAVTGVYIGAILAGLFAVLIPGGLGVREGAIVLALSSLIPGETAVIAAIVIRLVTIAAEVCLAAGFSLPYIWKGKVAEKDSGEDGLLYIVHEYPPIIGGTGVFVSNIVSEVGRERDIVVITAGESGKTGTETTGRTHVIRIGIPFRDKKFHYATIPSMVMFLLLATWHGWRAGKKRNLSGIHAFHLFPSGAVGIILSKFLGIPCHVTAIGAEVHDPGSGRALHSNRLYRCMIAGIMRRSDHLSAISRDIADRSRDYYNPDK
ncbi:MAG: glycosyltransferase, partial [Candidatus Krumholzibacteria bacterium]|nr:glycosyltransferase [Candidatus Krumholzibacteria bacterium]